MSEYERALAAVKQALRASDDAFERSMGVSIQDFRPFFTGDEDGLFRCRHCSKTHVVPNGTPVYECCGATDYQGLGYVRKGSALGRGVGRP